MTTDQDEKNNAATISTTNENEIDSDTTPQAESPSGDDLVTTMIPESFSINEDSGSGQTGHGYELVAATKTTPDRENKVSPDFTTVNQRDPSEGTAIVAPQEEIASIGDDSSRKDTEDPIFSNDITKSSGDQVTRTPPAGLELCEPLPAKEGQGCPEQYRYNTELTTEPPTVIVTTKEAIIEDAFEELSGTPIEISVHKNVPSSAIEETILPTELSRSHQTSNPAPKPTEGRMSCLHAIQWVSPSSTVTSREGFSPDLGTRHIVLDDPIVHQPGGEKDVAQQVQVEDSLSKEGETAGWILVTKASKQRYTETPKDLRRSTQIDPTSHQTSPTTADDLEDWHIKPGKRCPKTYRKTVSLYQNKAVSHQKQQSRSRHKFDRNGRTNECFKNWEPIILHPKRTTKALTKNSVPQQSALATIQLNDDDEVVLRWEVGPLSVEAAKSMDTMITTTQQLANKSSKRDTNEVTTFTLCPQIKPRVAEHAQPVPVIKRPEPKIEEELPECVTLCEQTFLSRNAPALPADVIDRTQDPVVYPHIEDKELPSTAGSSQRDGPSPRPPSCASASPSAGRDNKDGRTTPSRSSAGATSMSQASPRTPSSSAAAAMSGMDLKALSQMDPKLLQAARMDPNMLKSMGIDPKMLLGGMDPRLFGLDPKMSGASATASPSSKYSLNNTSSFSTIPTSATSTQMSLASSFSSGLDPRLLGLDPKMLQGLDEKALTSLGLDPNIVKSLLASEGKSSKSSSSNSQSKHSSSNSTNFKSTTNTTFSGLGPKMSPGVDPNLLQNLDPKMMSDPNPMALYAMGMPGMMPPMTSGASLTNDIGSSGTPLPSSKGNLTTKPKPGTFAAALQEKKHRPCQALYNGRTL